MFRIIPRLVWRATACYVENIPKRIWRIFLKLMILPRDVLQQFIICVFTRYLWKKSTHMEKLRKALDIK